MKMGKGEQKSPGKRPEKNVGRILWGYNTHGCDGRDPYDADFIRRIVRIPESKHTRKQERSGKEMRTIRVTGKGQMKVHPDMTRITITLEGYGWEYGETLEKASAHTEKMKELLEPFGFAKTDLKTLRFDVETVYERYKVNDTYKQRFNGYQFTHVMKVEFESDNRRLGKILYALAKSSLKPEFRLSYTVKDPEAVKNELLAKAVQDAAAKAGVLSSAAGLRLGDIQNVDYSWGRVDFEVSPVSRGLGLCEDLACPASSYDLDIEPDDIETEDTVTAVWEIL